MNAKKGIALALAALLLAALVACGGEAEPDSAINEPGYVAPTYVPQPTPTQDHALVSEEALERARIKRFENAGVFLVREYKRELAFDVSALRREMLRLEGANLGVAASMESFELAKQTADAANATVEAALAGAVKRLGEYLAQGVSDAPELDVKLSAEGLTWSSMLAFVRGCVLTMRAGAAESLLADALHIEADLTYSEEENVVSGALFVSAQPFTALWARASALPEERMTGRTLYAYLATVYGDDGRRKPYAEPEGAAEALADIALPTQGVVRETWYAARDGGSRLHTGVDIIAPKDTPIYACHAGWVTCVSEGVGAGYLVNVMDEGGYEFHYYHMVRLTSFLKAGDFVEQGQLVGHVGDTGNSATNHLHLSVIAPNGEYVDPYPYIIEAQKREDALN